MCARVNKENLSLMYEINENARDKMKRWAQSRYVMKSRRLSLEKRIVFEECRRRRRRPDDDIRADLVS